MNKYILIAKKNIELYKNTHNYRIFIPLINSDTSISYSSLMDQYLINWCNNDYNRITHNNILKEDLIYKINELGIGSGGTRNISGTSPIHNLLEKKVARMHKKESGLIFNSGFLANFSTFETFGKLFPNSTVFSDYDNHSSIIQGIKNSKLNKKIFKHNDMNHLEKLLKEDNSYYKIIAIESIYSMDGSCAELQDICFLKNKYNAFTFIDEIHAVGVYGPTGAGLTEMLNLQNEFDIIMGGFGKGFGTLGGYITGNADIIDNVRLNGSGFIFTTSIPPHLSYATIKSIDFIKNNILERQINRKTNIEYFIKLLDNYKIPYIKTNFNLSHIIAILIGNSEKCSKISKILLKDYGHYVQPINYPTVPLGTERFRISLSFDHTPNQINRFIKDLDHILKFLV